MTAAVFGLCGVVAAFILMALMPSKEPFHWHWTFLLSGVSGILCLLIATVIGFAI